MRDALASLLTHHRIFLTLRQEIDIEVSTSPIPEKGIVLMLSNRTEQQKLQKSLNQAERLQELGEMAATLAHEIRNPLGGIEGFARLLQRDLEGSSHETMINAILEGTGALNSLVSSVLDYARPMSLHFAPTNLVEVVRETLAHFAISADTLFCYFKTPFSQYTVSIDKVRFKHVLLNLLHNAQEADATEASVELTEGGTLLVKDNGIGISSKNLEKIFTPFFTTKNRGNGLGLAESLAVIKAHGGILEVFSEEGRGTQFTIKLVTETTCA
jgi:signal transduction histidine kinase